jgi:hypothetical protein
LTGKSETRSTKSETSTKFKARMIETVESTLDMMAERAGSKGIELACAIA